MTAASGKNPYRPGATPPLFLAGREPQLARFPKILRSAPEIPANVRITGLRGVGKSVLLKELEVIARQQGWAASRVQVEPRHNDEHTLQALIEQATRSAINKMSRAKKIKAGLSQAATIGRSVLSVTYEDMTLGLLHG